MLSILGELECSYSSEKVCRAIAITKALIDEKEKLIEENIRLNEQLKILRAKEYGKSSEKVKK